MTNEHTPDTASSTSALEARLAQLEATVERLADENAVLRRQSVLPAPQAAPSTGPVAGEPAPERELSRRAAFTRIGGAALGVATVYGLTQATPAAAAATPLLTETDTTASATTTLEALAPFDGDVLFVKARNNGDAVSGFGDGSGSAGVWGQSPAGWGVYGASTTGYGVYVASRLGIGAFTVAGAPTAGTYALRDIVGDQAGNLYSCVEAGSPGKWRQINAVIAPQFHAVTPFRACDTRAGTPSPGVVSAADVRQISIADARDLNTGAVTTANSVPAGATAITFNLTITDTGGAGFLAVTGGDATAYTASTINWTAAKQQIANGGVTPVNAARQIKVWHGGGGATHFIVDVTGYYL
ncbi:MAG: hypothetical protein JWM34_2640 [Ilumatobacteraceae bacterium]|nr:hypothetical protein [Ilumatobacteraceae bacterium]